MGLPARVRERGRGAFQRDRGVRFASALARARRVRSVAPRLEIGSSGAVYSHQLGFITLYVFDDVAEVRWFTPEEINGMDLSTLRDMDIKKMTKDYFSGKKYPLDIIRHTLSKN